MQVAFIVEAKIRQLWIWPRKSILVGVILLDYSVTRGDLVKVHLLRFEDLAYVMMLGRDTHTI